MEDLIRASALLISDEDEMGGGFDENDVDSAEKIVGGEDDENADMSNWEN